MAKHHIWWNDEWIELAGGGITPGGVAPTIVTVALSPMAEAGLFSQQLAASGDGPITWAVTAGALPSGLNLSSSGFLSGVPTSAGAYSFTVTASNASGYDTQAYSGTVVAAGVAPIITTTELEEIREDVEFEQILEATGDPTIIWSLFSGSLPLGLELLSDGTLWGTPTTPGPYSFVVRAQSAYGSDTQTYSGEVIEFDSGLAVTFTMTEGATEFKPWIELVPGATGTVTWVDSEDNVLTTGLKPTITVPTDRKVTMKVLDGESLVMSQVRIINIGFDASQDNGPETPSAAYNHPPQPVVNISSLTNLEGLVYFMAAMTPLTGTLNFTGLPNMLAVECYDAEIENVLFEGTAINRLCLELNRITDLDLTPIADSIRDLRSAQGKTGIPANFHCDTDLPLLWHYCVRSQPVAHHISLQQMPAVEQFWIWDTNTYELDDPVSEELYSPFLFGNLIGPEGVDKLLIALDDLGNTNGDFRVVTSFMDHTPTMASADARAALELKGWDLNGLPANEDRPYPEPEHNDWVLADLSAWSATPSVNSGVLSYTSNIYSRIYMCPDGRSAGDCFFEVAIDRSMVDGTEGTDWFAIFVNADASGRDGIRAMIRWPSVTYDTAASVTFASSNGAGGVAVATRRVRLAPEGWTDPGVHKLGLRHVGDLVSLYMDGVEVYNTRGTAIAGFNAGGYVGVGGDPDNTLRSYLSWGFTEL